MVIDGLQAAAVLATFLRARRYAIEQLAAPLALAHATHTTLAHIHHLFFAEPPQYAAD